MNSLAWKIDIDAAASRFMNGEKLADIGATYGVSASVLCSHLKKAGKGGMQQRRGRRDCQICGTTFLSPPSSNKKFCSLQCGKIGIARRPHVSQQRLRLRMIWRGMKARCLNSKMPYFKYYGARGVRVCSEWLSSFEPFYEWAITSGYADNLEIDRIDANGNYEPSNCRWASRTQQMQNTRTRSGGTSRFRGVSWCSSKKRWRVQINAEGRNQFVGLFKDEEEAALAYDVFAARLFGEFASLNFPRKEGALSV